MDPLRYKRPEQNRDGQTNKTNLRSPQPVPKVHLTRPLRANNHAPVGRRLPGLENQPASTPTPVASRMRAPAPAPAPVPTPIPAPVQAIAPKPAPPAPIKPKSKIHASNKLASVAVAQHRASKIVAPTPQQPAPTAITPQKLARTVPMDMDLPGEDSPSRWGTMFDKTKMRGFRRWAFRGTAIAIIMVITMGGLMFSQSYFKLQKVFKGGDTAEALKTNVNPDLLKGEGSGRINVLLLGRGGGTHDAPDLTDTILINSIDPVNKTSTLLSVPRDLWVNVPDHGVMKLNAAWQTGVFKYLGKNATGTKDPKAIAAGFDLVDRTLKDVLGIEINYNAIVDFQAFQQAVDTVNGVTVDVPTDLVDPTMAWENANDPVLAKAGVQTFDGKHALIYARSRETSSDFARGQRQRSLLIALKTKVADKGTLSNPLKISGLMNAFSNNVKTDLSIKDATRLYSIVKSIPDTKTTSISLADETNPLVTTGNITGQSVVLPKAGLFKYEAIQQYLRTQLKDPYMTKENAKVMVLNGTLMPGKATAKANELTAYGYNVIGTANTSNGTWTHTTVVDLSGGKKKYTRHFLEQRFGVNIANSLADTSIPTNGADFVIIIGTDEAYSN